MNKNLKPTIFLLLIILIFGGLFWFKIKKENEILKSLEGKSIYFYSKACPHCENVERFFQENNVRAKVQFEEMEVFENRENTKLLILLARKKCKLKEIGVPFFWNGKECIVGGNPIISYFKEKLTLFP